MKTMGILRFIIKIIGVLHLQYSKELLFSYSLVMQSLNFSLSWQKKGNENIVRP